MNKTKAIGITLSILGIILFIPNLADARRIRNSLDTPEIRELLPLIVEAITNQDKEGLSALINRDSAISSKNCWNNLLSNLDKDSWKAETYRALAITSNCIGEYRNSVEYSKQAAEEFKSLDMIEDAGDSLKQASTILKQNLSCYDEAIDLWIESAECYRQAENYLEAGKVYSWAIDITLNNVTKYNDDSQWLFDTYLACAECFKKAGSYKKASGKYDSAAYFASQKLYDFELSIRYNAKSAECALGAAEQFLVEDKLQDALLMFRKAVKKYNLAAALSITKLNNKAGSALYNSLIGETYFKIAELHNKMEETALEKEAWKKAANHYKIAIRMYCLSNNRSLAEEFKLKVALKFENVGMFEKAAEFYD
ncbi:MAG: hypothetical protein P9L98_04765 [Candidatus Kaelpia imicola]|nr:hypothetical protein [Candidatus Kaelpia imicola]